MNFKPAFEDEANPDPYTDPQYRQRLNRPLEEGVLAGMEGPESPEGFEPAAEEEEVLISEDFLY